MTTTEKLVFELFLPKGTLDWFDVIQGSEDKDNIYITLQEKNLPPIPERYKGEKISPKGFTDITITDFPIRGRRVLLTFKRRYWQVEGQKEYLKRDIKLTADGTQLEKEFAVFLKDDGGRGTILAGFYRKVSKDPSERI